MQGTIKVGIADDDHFVRAALTRSLRSFPDLVVVAAVEDGRPALEMAQSGAIDVLLLDIEMPGMDGRDVLNNIRIVAPHVRVVMYSSLPALMHAPTFLEAGATAYLEKPCDLARMAEAIREAARASRPH